MEYIWITCWKYEGASIENIIYVVMCVNEILSEKVKHNTIVYT